MAAVFDVERARRDTLGASRVAHLNNAGAALPPAQVTDAVIGHLRREAEIGGYEAAGATAEQIEAACPAIARLSGCAADEVAVLENATARRTWPSTRCPSSPATGSSPAERSMPATSSPSSRSPAGPAR